MRRAIACLVLAFFVLGFALPAWADSGAWFGQTKDKMVRGLENGLFGMGTEIYNHVHGEAGGFFKAATVGLYGGLNRGIIRTLVGTYEVATPFYHDQALLPDLDTLVK